jgi:hypothetical protein
VCAMAGQLEGERSAVAADIQCCPAGAQILRILSN